MDVKSKKLKTVIVIPAFNEAGTVGQAVKSVEGYGDVVVVDDGSSDDTSAKAGEAGAIVLRQPVNMGVGFTTRTGIGFALKKLFPDVIVTFDADGQHPAEEIEAMLDKIREDYEVVFTNRLGDVKQMPFTKRIGNKLLSLTTNLIAGSNVTDSQCGLRAFTPQAYRRFRFTADDYSFVSELVYEASRTNSRCVEIGIPSIYHPGRGYRGTDIITGVKIFFKTLLLRLRK